MPIIEVNKSSFFHFSLFLLFQNFIRAVMQIHAIIRNKCVTSVSQNSRGYKRDYTVCSFQLILFRIWTFFRRRFYFGLRFFYQVYDMQNFRFGIPLLQRFIYCTFLILFLNSDRPVISICARKRVKRVTSTSYAFSCEWRRHMPLSVLYSHIGDALKILRFCVGRI